MRESLPSSAAPNPVPGSRRAIALSWAAGLGVAAFLAWLLRDGIAYQIAHASVAPHAPDWDLFARQSLAIKVHVSAAVLAFALGLVILFRRKGTGFHRTLGWSWVILMGVTALSSLFITGLNGDTYSFIHLLSGWTLVALPMAVYAIRRKRVRAHQTGMTSLFIGGLIIAGAFAFIPERFMFEFLLG